MFYMDREEYKQIGPLADNPGPGRTTGEHNRASDKARRLNEYHDEQNKKDMSESNSPIDTDKPLLELSEVDIAYQILNESDKDNPIHFKKLIREVIARQNKIVQNEAAAISEIYTMINMDSRFQHVKDGQWGLADWYPPETKRSRSSSTTKTAAKTA